MHISQDWGHLTWRRKGPKEFEFRSAIFLDVSLAQILASEHELDLVPRLQPDLVEAPLQLVQGDRAREVTQTLAQVLMFKIEVVSERLRFFNHDFGCVAEFLSSDFPADGVPVPPRRRVPRVSAEMSTLMIPVGGGRGGTIIVQQTRVEPGFWVPDRVMAAILKTFVPGLLANTRKGVERVSDPQETQSNDLSSPFFPLSSPPCLSSPLNLIAFSSLLSSPSLLSSQPPQPLLLCSSSPCRLSAFPYLVLSSSPPPLLSLISFISHLVASSLITSHHLSSSLIMRHHPFSRTMWQT